LKTMVVPCLSEEFRSLAAEPKTILLVEDNADDERLTLRAIRLSEVPSIIQVARDGEEALNYLYGPDARIPDLVLMDLKLPKLDGLELLRKIRSRPATKLVPVVVLTSSDEAIDIWESYGLRANSYVSKPVDFEEFIEAVRQLGLYWLTMNVSAKPV
jgi:two-component system response regulator